MYFIINMFPTGTLYFCILGYVSNTGLSFYISVESLCMRDLYIHVIICNKFNTVTTTFFVAQSYEWPQRSTCTFVLTVHLKHVLCISTSLKILRYFYLWYNTYLGKYLHFYLRIQFAYCTSLTSSMK